jgi:hypothetical protein
MGNGEIKENVNSLWMSECTPQYNINMIIKMFKEKNLNAVEIPGWVRDWKKDIGGKKL